MDGARLREKERIEKEKGQRKGSGECEERRRKERGRERAGE